MTDRSWLLSFNPLGRKGKGSARNVQIDPPLSPLPPCLSVCQCLSVSLSCFGRVGSARGAPPKGSGAGSSVSQSVSQSKPLNNVTVIAKNSREFLRGIVSCTAFC